MRALGRPILTVTEGFKAPERVLVAFDGSSITRKGVDMVANSPLFRGLPVHLLMAGQASTDGPKHMAWATDQLEAAGVVGPNQGSKAREVLFKTREIVRESTPQGRFLLLVFVDMVDLFEQVMSTYYNYK